MVLPAAIILIAGALLILGVLVYKLSHPGAVSETANPSHYLLPSLEVTVPAGKADLPGWWIPGLRGAPGIILAPGYGMSRSDALSLAAVLHEAGFNLLIYTPRGSTEKGASTLGLREPADMLQAIKLVQGRPESNRERLGVWGVDVEANAALRAAAECKEVRAIVADSAFESVPDFIGYKISEDFGVDSRILQLGAYQIFRLAHIAGGAFRGGGLDLQALSGRTILFIKGENRRGLGNLATAIYDRIQPRKEMISFKTARVRIMSGEDIKSYDRHVTNFFHLNLRNESKVKEQE